MDDDLPPTPPPVDLDLAYARADAFLAALDPTVRRTMERLTERLAAPFHLTTPAELRAFGMGLIAAYNLSEETTPGYQWRDLALTWAAQSLHIARGR